MIAVPPALHSPPSLGTGLHRLMVRMCMHACNAVNTLSAVKDNDQPFVGQSIICLHENP